MTAEVSRGGDIAAALNRAAESVRKGRYGEAAEEFKAAITRGDDRIATLANLAQCILRSERPVDAGPVLNAILSREPNHIDALANLGGLLALSGRAAEGESFLRRAVAVDPNHGPAWSNLAAALEKQARYPDALSAAERVISINPRSAEAHFIAGICHAQTGALADAVEFYRRAIKLQPSRIAAYVNLAAVLQETGRTADALHVIDRAVAIAPDHATAQFDRAMLLFARGELSAAWRAYDWRWKTPGITSRWRDFPAPRWKGEKLPKGKKLLVWSEQGVGDEILFGSMLPDVLSRGIEIVFECDPRLVKLFARSFPKATVVPRTDPSHGKCTSNTIGAQIPAADLGKFLRPTWDSFSARKPFLIADKRQGAKCRKIVHGKKPVRAAGLSWLSFNRAFQAQKSIPLARLAPLLATPGMAWVDVQYGDTDSERAAVPEAQLLKRIDGLDIKNDLDGLAALISACDVIVTVCNTVAHLAGALGIPAYVLVPKGRGRLWWTFEDRPDSPWYGSVRFYRQSQDGDWTAPLAALAADLVQTPAQPSPGQKPRAKAR